MFLNKNNFLCVKPGQTHVAEQKILLFVNPHQTYVSEQKPQYPKLNYEKFSNPIICLNIINMIHISLLKNNKMHINEKKTLHVN